MTNPETKRLDDDDLETILIVARNGQSGRITEFEITALVNAYRNREGLMVAAYKRGFEWCNENEGDEEYLNKAAHDYADAVLSARTTGGETNG